MFKWIVAAFCKNFYFQNISNTGCNFSTIKISLSFIQKAKKKLSRSPKPSQRKKKHCWDCRLQTLCTFKKLARRLKLQFVTNSLLFETTLVKEIFSIKDSRTYFFHLSSPKRSFFIKFLGTECISSRKEFISSLAESDSVLCFSSSAAAATEREFPRFLAFCLKICNKTSLLTSDSLLLLRWRCNECCFQR